MKIENTDIRKLFSGTGICPLCGKRRDLDPHHVMTRGAGGSDIRCDLLPVCRECHSCYVDSLDGKAHCLTLIAKREKATVDEIKAVNYFVANQLHRLDSEWLIEEKITAWDGSPRAKELVRRDLTEAGVLS